MQATFFIIFNDLFKNIGIKNCEYNTHSFSSFIIDFQMLKSCQAIPNSPRKFFSA